MERWQELLERGRRNGGVVLLNDVVQCGIPPRTFRDNAKRLGWPHLFLFAWGTPGSADSYDRTVAAVAMSLRGAWLFTGETTLWLHGCLNREPEMVHVLLPPQRHHAPLPGVRFARGRWVDGDKPAVVQGRPSVSLGRAITDLAAHSSIEQIVRHVATMDRLRLGGAEDVASVHAKRGRYPGAGRVGGALRQLGQETTHSKAESIGRAAITRIGLRPEPRPYLVEERGIKLGEIDVAFPPLLYGAEIDGPHHLLAEVAQADKVRDRALEQRGWRIDRFTTDEVERAPAAFAAQVRQGVLASAARLGLPAMDPRWMVTAGG